MKQKPALLLVSILTVLILIAGSLWLYDWVLGSTLEASTPISAATLALPSPTSPPDRPATQPDPVSPTQQMVEPTQPVAQTQPPAAQPEPPASQPQPPSSALERYTILSDQSQVRFSIYEELNGVPTTVVGVTNQVAGEAALDLSDLSQTLLGEIRINARTLVTNEDRRNQAIRNRILNTDQFEYITFLPAQITGLDGSAVVGQTITFQVSGDLTIRQVTLPVVFDVTTVLGSNNQITGTATTVIQRSNFQLAIPSVPFVANVGEDVTLEIDFVLAQ
jgi:polyisoprenoid-binding protein YceI